MVGGGGGGWKGGDTIRSLKYTQIDNTVNLFTATAHQNTIPIFMISQ